jgi:hypothetical protein
MQIIKWLRSLWRPNNQKELFVENNQFMYTEEQLMARLRFFIGVCLALTLTGIVFVVLYSLIFVTQPLNAISPIDQKFFELIVPIATFLTGTLSGIMLAGNDKNAQMEALKSANKGWDKPPTPPAPSMPPMSSPSMSSFGNTFAGSAGMKVEPTFSPPPVETPGVVVGFGGKLAPPPAAQPEI